MDYSFTSQDPAALDTEILGVIVHDVDAAASDLSALDDATGGAISRAIERGHLRPGKGDAVVVSGGSTGPHRVLLIGLAEKSDDHAEALRSAGARLATTARATRASSTALTIAGTATAADAAAAAEGFALAAYKYDRFKSSGGDDDDNGDAANEPTHPSSLVFVGLDDDAQAAAQRALTIAEATNWARDLANAPGNHMTPEMLAGEAKTLADAHEHLTLTTLDGAAIEAEGMGMLAAVGQGSANDSRVIVLEWNPPEDTSADADRIAIVGKAVTFDTGGISIKPSGGMTDMKMDKSGGCAVLGGMRAIAELKLPKRVLAVVGSAENMPSSKAYKPGDVITAMDGTTIEVTNTDAEGRLVLGDAISYARKLGCSRIVEASTLTGAMVIALGHYFAGAVAEDNDWTADVLAAAKRTGDHAWHLPMHKHYKGQLKSDCADMVNSGGRAGGALYAGLFLQHFAKDTPFVHLDVAGTAMLDKPRDYYSVKGASGWGVRLFTDLVANA